MARIKFLERQYVIRINLKRTSALILSFALTFLISCRNMNSNNDQVVGFNPSVGAEYSYEINESSEVIQEIGKSENKVKVTTSNKTELSYKIIEKTNNEYHIVVSFISCEIENHAGGNPVNAYIEKDSTHFNRNIESLKGSVFNLNLRANGKIKSIVGYKEFVDKCNALQVGAFSEEYFKEIFEQLSEVLPDQKVTTGSSWENQAFRRSKTEYLTNRSTLDSISHGIAYIRTSSIVKQELLALNRSLAMNGMEQGGIEIEVNTGMLMKCKKEMRISGSCKIGGVDVSQNVIVISKINGRRSN